MTRTRRAVARLAPLHRASLLATVLVAIALAPADRAAALTYDVGTIALTGHTITGSITTDGTLGALTTGNITGVNIQVTGPYAWTFNTLVGLSIFNVDATPTALTTIAGWFSLDQYPTGAPCTAGNDCNTWIMWEDFAPLVEYRVRDLTDVLQLTYENVAVSGGPVLIGTIVPEPGTAALLLVGALLLPRRDGRARRA